MKIQRTPTEHGLEIDGYNVENVYRFTYFGATFTNTVEDSTEVKRRIGIAKNATIALNNIWKNRGITLTTKIRLLKTMVFSIISYCSECWVLKATDRQKLYSFEMWCYRRFIRISWKEKTNEQVIRRVNCRKRLITVLDERKLSFVGHQLRNSDTLEKTLLIGSVYGKRSRGRPRTRFCDNIKEACGDSLVEIERKAQDRGNWRSFVQWATTVRTRTMR